MTHRSPLAILIAVLMHPLRGAASGRLFAYALVATVPMVGFMGCQSDAVAPRVAERVAQAPSRPLSDAVPGDADFDGVADGVDNCPAIANPDQSDFDADGAGDACDPVDVDNDGVPDVADNCPAVANTDQSDLDFDGLGDACDADNDNDGILNEADNCPVIANPDQSDFDNDGAGNSCDPDDDNDNVVDAEDACPNTSIGTPVNAAGCDLVTYAFSGFFAPVDNPPVVNIVKAGSAIPVRFSLGGDKGLDIFETGSPSSVSYSCDASVTSVIEQTVSDAASSLTYSSGNDQYTYVWKTDKAWGGRCRKLVLTLKNGTTHTALFSFTR